MTIGWLKAAATRPTRRESAMMSAAWTMNNASGLWRMADTSSPTVIGRDAGKEVRKWP
jgi:hypothetical protein